MSGQELPAESAKTPSIRDDRGSCSRLVSGSKEQSRWFLSFSRQIEVVSVRQSGHRSGSEELKESKFFFLPSFFFLGEK